MSARSGKAWFYAMGQRHEALGLPNMPGIKGAKHWAKRAYFNGRLSVPMSRARFRRMWAPFKVFSPPIDPAAFNKPPGYELLPHQRRVLETLDDLMMNKSVITIPCA